MNIFFLSRNPEVAATMACDKHVVKMILETTQLLYTAQHLNDNNLDECPYVVYKIAHKNHPSAIWTRSSMDHYMWLCELGLAYCDEYRHRYGSYKEHSCEKHLRWLYQNPPQIEYNGFDDPPQCMPDKYKDEDCVDAYRNYYIGEKLPFAKYTNCEVPYWLEEYF
jgi:hypothetical protein